MPGVDWAYSFLKRNSSQLNKSHCQNINSVRAGIGVNEIIYLQLSAEISGQTAKFSRVEMCEPQIFN